MTAPVRLRLSRASGFDLQAHSMAVNRLPAVNVARPGPWGNPFVIGQPSGHSFEDGGDPTLLISALTAQQAVAFYDDLILGIVGPEMHPAGHAWKERFGRRTGWWHPSEAARSLLRGRNLACWCALCPAHAATGKPFTEDCPDCAPCHADVLGRRANPIRCETVRGAA